MNKEKYNIALVGATGLVGSVFIKLLDEYQIPIDKLRFFASKKSLGKKIRFQEKSIEVEELSDDAFLDMDFVLFSAGKEVSKKYAPIAEKSGAIVIDNSSYFRMQKDIPLVIPEINFNDILHTDRKIIANPNCSTIQAVRVLSLIQKHYHIKNIVYNTYQSVSGSGMKGVFDYQSAFEGYPCEFYPYDISKTCIPLIGKLGEDNCSEEEIKMREETKKILHLENVNINATCVRVPIVIGHGVSVYLETEEEIDLKKVEDELINDKNIILKEISSTIEVSDTDKISVGRLRKGESNNSLLFYCTADNLRVGASSNALKILLEIIKK